MRVSLVCKPSWFGAWAVDLQKDVSSGRWLATVTRDEPPYDFDDPEDVPLVDSRDDAEGEEQDTRSAGSAMHRGVRVERELTGEEGTVLERYLVSIALPLHPEFAMGCDGTSWKFQVENGWNRVDLSWWPELPAIWRPLRPLLDFLAAVAELPADHPERPA